MSNVGKYKILLVEDSKIAQLGAELNLTQFGCEVDIAETGTEAIKLIDKKFTT
ncbi:MAG: hypothetical protein HWD59_03125 [Coxiellaceae bacterium]|nr:MAG: hypothetical protein HWD59_03125 [Coxiellaceae bacterium]